MVLLDSVEIEWAEVYNLQATGIDYVEIYKGGASGNPGVISFRMPSREEYRKMVPASPSSFRGTLPMTYHVAKDFYAPRYDGSNEQANLPDIRNTVYWAPMITTDKKGEVEIDSIYPIKQTSC